MLDDLRPGCLRNVFKWSPKTPKHTSQKPAKLPHDVDSKSHVFINSQCAPCCEYSFIKAHSQESLPDYASVAELTTAHFCKTVDECLETFNPQLRDISLKIHAHPELKFEEKFAHDLLTSFMSNNGFRVTRHYLGLDTAWKAEFIHGKGGRVVGINSEMDALEIGHGCGHNLIAVSGCAIALAIKSALEAHDIPGKIVLLGTPAEEGGAGKVILLECGAYKEMDLCIMCHPAPGPSHSAFVVQTLAMQSIEVDYFGKSAHAGASPWEGTNALDAAFVAYSSISALRQQMRPDYRVHGIVKGADASPAVIPDHAYMRWFVRAPTHAELQSLSSRVQNCLEAGALATACRVKIAPEFTYFDLNQNSALADEFRSAAKHYGIAVSSESEVATASTDFGNVSYELPALHPGFAIPTEVNGGNHTPAFVRSAATPEAHEAMMQVSAVMALTGLRALCDDIFFQKVQDAFKSSVLARTFTKHRS